MEQCSICLDNIDSSGPTLACGHRFHAACLARQYRGAPTVNFPGEAPLASVLAALPDAPPPPPPPPAPLPRSARTRTRKVIVDAPDEIRRDKRPKKREIGTRVGMCVEGAEQKQNGKWAHSVMFPGREFDDLDEYRAAKRQRAEQRAAYLDQNIGRRK